jgi:hypothetical protein
MDKLHFSHQPKLKSILPNKTDGRHGGSFHSGTTTVDRRLGRFPDILGNRKMIFLLYPLMMPQR